MKIKIATITFNHAHNHGSMLQAYALQQFICKLGEDANIDVDYKIIDFNTDKQRELYAVFKKDFSLKSIVKNSIAFLHVFALKKRHCKFEQFLKEYCNLTCRYSNQEDLEKNVPEADIYISGSDQLWNVRALDFSKVYYLPFVKRGKKISYAASFGPLKIDWRKYGETTYASMLSEYSAISTRETGSADNVEKLLGKRPEVHVDPTFLLTKEEWRNIQSDVNHKNGKYILLYCLEPSYEQMRMANLISKKLNLPILVLRYNNKNDWFNIFDHKYDAGPKDFLSYIDNAAMILSSSFHGTAFSLIYHKPFFVFNGMSDNRISSILTRTGLTDRSINSVSDVDNVKIRPLDDELVEKFISEERERSAQFLNKVIGFK